MSNALLLLYNEILWRPLFNALIFLYSVLPWQDMGLAVFFLSLSVRALLTPLLLKQQKSQKDLARVQPEIKRIQERYKSNKEEQTKQLMELYKKEDVNPFSGCVVVLIQIPLLIALFHVFQKGLLPESLLYLYSFIPNPGVIRTVSAGVLDLAKPNIILGVIAAVTQLLQTRLTGTVSPLSSDGKKGEFANMLQWQMTYLLPILILVWSYSFPSILVLYWTFLNLFGIIQELVMRQLRSKSVPSFVAAQSSHVPHYGSGDDKK